MNRIFHPLSKAPLKIKMRRFVVFGILCWLNFFAFAQKPFSLLDTFQLEEVVSVGQLKKYQSGVKIESIGAEFITLETQGGIENLLKRFTPIYVKSDAGGLSTIRFRGTSPNHTAINFGGVNINSLTLGHSNLSAISTFLFDEVNVQFGSSSAVNGSGAIGGALYLKLNENWTNGINSKVQITTGSFGEKLAGTKLFIGNGRWELGTRAFIYRKKNDFPFLNFYTGDITNEAGIKDIQNGASLENYGVLQEINFRFSDKENFKSKIWFSDSWRQVQPNMQSNYNFTGTPEIRDKNLRFWAAYENAKRFVNYKLGSGYIHDFQVFDNIAEQIIQTDRFILDGQVNSDFTNGAGIKAGAKYEYIVPNVHAYSDSVIKFEQHFDVFVSSFYQWNKNFKVTLNLRQSFVSNFKVPFTPSLGADYILQTSVYSYLKFSAALAKSFRVPTLNDRFWGIQGNPDLQPEKGNNFELGSRYFFNTEKYSAKIGITAFYMNVDNWIEWRNFGIWKARNVQEVTSKGIEMQVKNCFTIRKIDFDLGINLTHNPVEIVKTSDQTGLLNRQLNYVPKNMANGYLSLKFDQWYLIADCQYTGQRYTDDFGDKLPGYLLANGTVAYTLKGKRSTCDLSLSANNLFNKNYQNEKYYAMPGRSVRIGIQYNLNIIQKNKTD